ncbi:MAG: hypothetical protein OXC44_07210 [Proteobacteria bacterium]|nr:hypothetical protein [Pseudomonadota bacterium]
MAEQAANPDSVHSHPGKSSKVDVKMCQKLISTELQQLNILCLNPDMESHSNETLYASLFPLTCDHCQKHYPDRKYFLEHTTSLKQGSLFFDEKGLRESRACSCGKVISLWEKGVDRRNGSYLGVLKRILFENCLAKLEAMNPQNNPEDLKVMLRHFFKSPH